MERIEIGKKLGEGNEKDVYIRKGRPDQVVGVYKKEWSSESKIKGRFYLMKLLHILYPEGTRDIYASYSEPPSVISPRVESKFLRKIRNNIGISDRQKILEIRQFTKKMSQDFGVYCDPMEDNFMYDEKDNLIYIDTISPWSRGKLRPNSNKLIGGKLNLDLGKIRIAIESLTDQDRAKANVYLERLLILAKEDEVEF